MARTVTRKPAYKATVLSTVATKRRNAAKRDKWLWEGYLPPASLGLFDGDPGLGKSMVTLDVAARVTKGLAWPDKATGTEPGNVLIIASEDGPTEIARRLSNHGADLTRTILLENVAGQTPEFPRDISIIGDIMAEHKVKLVIIDPIMVYLGVTASQDQQVRKAVHPLAQLAQSTGATIIMVRHLTKSGGKNAKQAGGGSMGLIGQCRFGYLFGADPEDPKRRVMASIKMNLAAEPPSRAFRLETHNKLPRVAWEDEPETRLSADDLLRGRSLDKGQRNEREEAVKFLRDTLESYGGVCSPKVIMTEGREAGFTQSQLRTAKMKLEVFSRKKGDVWFWCLPGHDPRMGYLSVV